MERPPEVSVKSFFSKKKDLTYWIRLKRMQIEHLKGYRLICLPFKFDGIELS